MPNFDGSHYFLTVLAPVRTEAFDDEGKVRTHLHALRETLDLLPTARQMPVNEHSPLDSPFARHLGTHFARFVVIDNVVYNGRIRVNAIWAAFTGAKALDAQKADRLSRPYLLFAVDFDARTGDEDEVKRYLTDLWNVMPVELCKVFRHCDGFAIDSDASMFVAYILRCRIETTMPFNDYGWRRPLAKEKLSKGRKVADVARRLFKAGPAGTVLAVALLVTTISLSAGLFASPLWCLAMVAFAAAAVTAAYRSTWIRAALATLATALTLLGWLFTSGPWGITTVVGLVATVGALHKAVVALGAQPFPPEPDTDLRSVLKALYLQQRFVEFAIANQLAGPQELHHAFKAFIDTHRPAEAEPTQVPGVIRTK
ncbi:MAG TPA: hypothetical protein VHL31_09170 [Geminicoccus sp.]|jgi:hypothetical protein|uniref:hypothetical protein n=1 Tax=Geminicoccus sp. TaxID=2024832 RepID=UPI002E318847|nr:hypothetical protein [Geminicoccus sp.]HEX2526452.1 hypothetical protein [Geminicoccus sp.]